jgi:hypothetical protein
MPNYVPIGIFTVLSLPNIYILFLHNSLTDKIARECVAGEGALFLKEGEGGGRRKAIDSFAACHVFAGSK